MGWALLYRPRAVRLLMFPPAIIGARDLLLAEARLILVNGHALTVPW